MVTALPKSDGHGAVEHAGSQADFVESDVGRIPRGWKVWQLAKIAKLESGHTPSRQKPEYWGGTIPWVSLHDTDNLDNREILTTAQSVTPLGIANSSARILPKGTVVFSRTATVGKATTLGQDMATSQDFACYVCGPEVHNHYLVYLFRFMAPEWKKLMAGSIHNTVYMPVFRSLRVVLPPKQEQEAIAEVLADVGVQVDELEALIFKKQATKQAVMQGLLSRSVRIPGFNKSWNATRLALIGSMFGGLTGKTKEHFGRGDAKYVPFLNVVSNVQLDLEDLAYVDVVPRENQNSVLKGDLLFNGSSETPDEVGMCCAVTEDVERLYLNSFCFGLRPYPHSDVSPLFLAYLFRGKVGRRIMSVLAQGATRYNLSKRALLEMPFDLPEREEQDAIAACLMDHDKELQVLKARLAKCRLLQQGLTEELLTGRTRLM